MRTAPWVRAAFLAIPLVAGSAPARAAWPTDGLPVCTATGTQRAPALVLDPLRNATVAWIDDRSGIGEDVYVQRVLADGAPFASWPADGIPATDYAPSRTDLVALADGFGGVFLAWAQRAVANGPLDIRVLRLGTGGQPAVGWSNEGLLVCGAVNDQRRPRLGSDGAGGVYVVWEDHRGAAADVYASRVTGFGQVVTGWPNDGRALCAAAGAQTRPEIMAEPGGDALVLWRDERSGEADLYGIRVSPNGVIIGWAPNGLPVCSAAGDQNDLALLADGTSGLFATWSDARSGVGRDIYALRLGWNGARPSGWLADGNLVCGESGDQITPTVASDSAGGIIVAWRDRRSDPAGDVYAQRLDGAGALQWSATGAPVALAGGSQADVYVVPDGVGGAYVAWLDGRDSLVTGADVWAQRLRPDGTRSWPIAGFPVSRSDGDARDLAVIGDRAGGAYLAWSDARALATQGRDVYLMRIAAEALEPTRADSLQAVHDDGQTFVAWSGPSSGITWRVYRSENPIVDETDLAAAEPVATVGDSSGFDRRLSAFLNVAHGYVPAEPIGVRGTDRNLFVVTAESSGARHYAITAQAVGHPENRTLIAGANATADPIEEAPGVPVPRYQRTVSVNGVTADVYALWTWHRSIPGFPAMANLPGLAFDCAVATGGVAPDHPLMIRPHARKGHFLQAIESTGLPGEWRLALDDPLPPDENSFAFGWHEALDPTRSELPAPSDTGKVVDYTLRRLIHTIGWARRGFPVDTHRVYLQGYSMAGFAALLVALERPEWIAAAQLVTAKVDMLEIADDLPECAFNPGGLLRDVADRLWGTIAANLPDADGAPVYQRLSAPAVLDTHPDLEMPPLVTFDGRHDEVMGWTEKIDFYDALQRHRHGARVYWDNRTHLGSGSAAWTPMQQSSELAPWRTDRSYPALSACSADGDPGNGAAADGDSVGTLNGHLVWQPDLVDLPLRWEVTLGLRGLATRWGPLPAPDSLVTHVTPRRLQQLAAAAGDRFAWSVRRLPDSALVQQGEVFADSLGLVTIPAVKVAAGGSRLRLERLDPLAVGPPRIARLSLGSLPNPLRTRATLAVSWPSSARGRVELFDAQGRRAVGLSREGLDGHRERLTIDPARLAPGLYFLRVRSGGEVARRRFVVLH